jgi:hypothetical protein
MLSRCHAVASVRKLTRILHPVTTVDLRTHMNGILLHGPQLDSWMPSGNSG